MDNVVAVANASNKELNESDEEADANNEKLNESNDESIESWGIKPSIALVDMGVEYIIRGHVGL